MSGNTASNLRYEIGQIERQSLKTTLLILLTIICLFAALFWFAVGGTKVVRSGTYGPFTIGEEKATSVETLRSIQAWPARAIPSHDTLLESPDVSELERNFSLDEGIVVWFGGPVGNPMRLEFDEDVLVRAWPIFPPRTGSNPNRGYDEIDDAMLALQENIEVGMSRSDAFKHISEGAGVMKNFVSAHVADFEGFGTLFYEELQSDAAYSNYVFSKSAWEFRGLERKPWYSFFTDPHYSVVRLFFVDDKLIRIDHLHAPFEMP